MVKEDLATFARTYRPGKPGMACWACTIPEAAEIAKHYRGGTDPGVIRAWLIERRGYASIVATRNRLQRHLTEHVGRARVAA